MIQVSHAEKYRLISEGECPDRASILLAINNSTSSLEVPSNVMVVVTAVGKQSKIELFYKGQQVVERVVDSQDCLSLAGIFAIIVEEALWSIVEQTQKKTEVAPQKEQQTVPTQVRSVLANRSWALGAVGGVLLDSSLAQTASAAYVQLDLMLLLSILQVRTAVFTVEKKSLETLLKRRQWGARFEIGDSLKTKQFQIGANLGFGLSIFDIRSSSSEHNSFFRVHPFLSGSLIGHVTLAESLAFRTEFSSAVYPVQDRYQSKSMVIATSPGVQWFFAFGLEWRP